MTTNADSQLATHGGTGRQVASLGLYQHAELI